MRNRGILVGKAYDSRRSVWRASKTDGLCFEGMQFLYPLFSFQLIWHFKFYSFMFMHRISTWVVCLSGKHPKVFL